MPSITSPPCPFPPAELLGKTEKESLGRGAVIGTETSSREGRRADDEPCEVGVFRRRAREGSSDLEDSEALLARLDDTGGALCDASADAAGACCATGVIRATGAAAVPARFTTDGSFHVVHKHLETPGVMWSERLVGRLSHSHSICPSSCKRKMTTLYSRMPPEEEMAGSRQSREMDALQIGYDDSSVCIRAPASGCHLPSCSHEPTMAAVSPQLVMHLTSKDS